MGGKAQNQKTSEQHIMTKWIHFFRFVMIRRVPGSSFTDYHFINIGAVGAEYDIFKNIAEEIGENIPFSLDTTLVIIPFNFKQHYAVNLFLDPEALIPQMLAVFKQRARNFAQLLAGDVVVKINTDRDFAILLVQDHAASPDNPDYFKYADQFQTIKRTAEKNHTVAKDRKFVSRFPPNSNTIFNVRATLLDRFSALSISTWTMVVGPFTPCREIVLIGLLFTS